MAGLHPRPGHHRARLAAGGGGAGVGGRDRVVRIDCGSSRICGVWFGKRMPSFPRRREPRRRGQEAGAPLGPRLRGDDVHYGQNSPPMREEPQFKPDWRGSNPGVTGTGRLLLRRTLLRRRGFHSQ
ncbi:hypothetical protein MTBUT4_90043 [Magnetospirillum sp. UT-4]|nr:hypothetical protein MTBUT4_90043 [Magnetospirillum sp. UT-4]